MSDTELLLKEIDGLPSYYIGEILDFVGYLKHKDSLAEKNKPARRGFGCAKGEGDYWMADDFDAPLDDFKDYM
jgi:hypothetical protein